MSSHHDQQSHSLPKSNNRFYLKGGEHKASKHLLDAKITKRDLKIKNLVVNKSSF